MAHQPAAPLGIDDDYSSDDDDEGNGAAEDVFETVMSLRRRGRFKRARPPLLLATQRVRIKCVRRGCLLGC